MKEVFWNRVLLVENVIMRRRMEDLLRKAVTSSALLWAPGDAKNILFTSYLSSRRGFFALPPCWLLCASSSHSSQIYWQIRSSNNSKLCTTYCMYHNKIGWCDHSLLGVRAIDFWVVEKKQSSAILSTLENWKFWKEIYSYEKRQKLTI